MLPCVQKSQHWWVVCRGENTAPENTALGPQAWECHIQARMGPQTTAVRTGNRCLGSGRRRLSEGPGSLGKSLRVAPEWPCVLPFLTWDPLQSPVALASEGQGSPSGAKTSETLGEDQPMPSPSPFASSVQEKRAGPGAVGVFRKVLTPEKGLNPAGWMVCQPVEKQPPGRRAPGSGGGRRAGGAGRGEEVEESVLPRPACLQRLHTSGTSLGARQGAPGLSGLGLSSRLVSGAPALLDPH